MLSLCRSILERRPPEAAVRGIRLVATPTRARREQLRLFGLPTVAPEKLATAVAKVAAIVGDDRVGVPILRESHDPEGYQVGRFDPPPPPEVEREPVACEGVAGLRLYRPPLEAEVRMGREGPLALRAGAVAGWIVGFAGPWRLDTGWHEKSERRDTFDVELSDGAVYRMAQNLDAGTWSVVGRYD
jgi:protein ImuB